MTSPALVSAEPGTERGFARELAVAATLQMRVLDALARQGSASTTTEIRAAVDHSGCGPRVVIERVYAALVALERKGLVQRGANSTGSRPVWKLGTPPPGIDTSRSHTMRCGVPDPVSPRVAVAAPLTAHCLEERIAQIETPDHAREVAEVILGPWETGAWQRWKVLVSAPLAGWLFNAHRVDASSSSSRVDWILRALAHRTRWSSAARGVAQDQQLQESLRSVSRLDDHQFTDVSWMLVLVLIPWSSCVSAPDPMSTIGDW